MNTMMKKTLTGILFVLAFAVYSTSAFAATGVLKRPYLIYPGVNTTMEVLWQDNDTETTNVLSWGTDTTYSLGSVTVAENSSAANMHQHIYTITGLTPNTTYYYQVADATYGVYGTGSFITAPVVGQSSVRFLAMGDSRSEYTALDSVMQAMKTFYSQPGNSDYQRLAIHNGDWVSSDGESNWTNEWFVPAAADIINFTANTPLNGCEGNHDTDGSYPNGYSIYFPKYWPFPYPAKTTYSSGYNNLYWSFDYGPVHITILDEYSNFASGSAQYNWLVNDLATTTQPWKVLIYHEPAYSAGSDSDNTTVRTLETLVTQYNVDLIYSGHSHNYARTGAYNLTQANGDQIALNVPHFTSGGGGAPIYQPDMTNTGSYPHVITAWPAFEFMTFDVEGKTLTMTAYQVNGVSTSSLPSGTLTYAPIETTVLNHFTNVSSQVGATSTGILYSRLSKLYTTNLTITNNGTTPITGNIDVVLDGMINLQGLGTPSNQYSTANPKLTSMIASGPATGRVKVGSTYVNGPGALISTVTLVNATGSNNGEPMIRATTGGLAPGASLTVPLQFSNPNGATITFNPIILQE